MTTYTIRNDNGITLWTGTASSETEALAALDADLGYSESNPNPAGHDDLRVVEAQAAALGAILEKYARETAADTGEDYATAVGMMRDEPQEVAAGFRGRITAEDVIAWCEAQR